MQVLKVALSAFAIIFIASAVAQALPIPMFADERQGAPGIPAGLDYALGSSFGADLMRSTFYGAYALLIALALGVTGRLSSQRREDRER